MDSFSRLARSARAARHANDAGNRADAADDLRELPAVADLEPERQRRRVALGVDPHVLDVGVRGGDPARDLGEQSDAVERANLDLGVELALHALGPVHRDPLRRLLAVLREITAGAAVDHDAAAARHEAHDLVAGYRVAAARVVDDHALGARDLEGLALLGRRGVRLVLLLREHARDHRRQALAQADLLEQRLHVLHAELFVQRVEPVLRHFLQARRVGHELLVEQPPPELLCLVAFQVLEIPADRVTRLGGGYEVDPVRVRARAARRDDLDRLAVVQGGLERHEPAVDLRRDAAVADVGVHGIREVDGGRAPRQPHDRALRREHVDLVGEEVGLDGLQELLGVRRALHLHEASKPFARALFGAVGMLVDGLVLPVRGEAALRNLVHLLGADLHLERQAVRPEQRRVQRLVAVDARDGDKVLEAARHRLERLMREAERAVAAVDVGHDDAHAVYVDDVREMRVLALHLEIDAVEVLFARVHARGDLRVRQRLPELALDLTEQLPLITLRAPQRALQHLVAIRIERLEAELLELDLEGVDAEPIRDRRVDVERLTRDAPLLLYRQRADRAHVVRAVGELHEDHAQILRHREQHLAEALGLRLGRAIEAQMVDLAHAVDEARHVLAEFLLDVLDRAAGVLDDVVQ